MLNYAFEDQALKIGHIDYLLYKSNTHHVIFTQGLSLNQMTPIVGVFLDDKTCASKIFAR